MSVSFFLSLLCLAAWPAYSFVCFFVNSHLLYWGASVLFVVQTSHKPACERSLVCNPDGGLGGLATAEIHGEITLLFIPKCLLGFLDMTNQRCWLGIQIPKLRR